MSNQRSEKGAKQIEKEGNLTSDTNPCILDCRHADGSHPQNQFRGEESIFQMTCKFTAELEVTIGKRIGPKSAVFFCWAKEAIDQIS